MSFLCNRYIAVVRAQKRGRQNRPRFQSDLLGCLVLWRAIPVAYAAAIAISTAPFIPAISANASTRPGIGTIVVIVTRANKDTTGKDAKTATRYAVHATIVSVISEVNKCQAFDCRIFNRGPGKVAGCCRCCLYASHGSHCCGGRQSK